MTNTHDAWTVAISDHLEWLVAAGRPMTTRRLRRHQLRRLTAHIHVAPHEATVEHWARALAQWPDWAPSTRQSHRAAARSFTQWLHVTGRSPVDAGAHLPIVRLPRLRPRPAGDDALAEALVTAPRRVAVMIRLGAYVGLRCCEIARIRAADISGPRGERDVLVKGKGGHERVVPIDDTTAVMVAELARSSPGGWAFPTRYADTPLDPATVSRLVSRALPDGVTAHMLRHRFAGRAYNRGGRDLRAVQELLGHATIATTQIYVGVDAEALRRAAAGAA